MIRFEKLSATEKAYPFVDAVVADDYKNGTFGNVADGAFTAGTGFKAIMQVEKGDDMKSDKFKIFKDEHARIADFTKADGQIVNITADELPETYKEGDKLVADATGVLTISEDATAEYFEVIEVTRYGVRAVVTVGTATVTNETPDKKDDEEE